MNRLLREHRVGAGDHLVIHSTHILLTKPLVAIGRSLPAGGSPMLHLRFIGASASTDHDPHFDELKELVDSGRTFLYAEMRAVADAVSARFGGARVDLLRLALPPAASALEPHEKPSRPFRLLYFGELREEKGWQRLPAILHALGERAGEFHLTMHVGNPHTLKKRVNAADMKAIRAAGIELVAKPLDDRDLSRLLAAADLVLLPYRPHSYRLRGSGVALDSIAHGVPLVVPDDCALTEFVEAGNGLSARTDADFAAAILRIRDDYPSFLALARAAAAGSRSWVADSGIVARVAGETQG